MLIVPRFTLALALAHTENECLLLPMNLRARSREMGYLPKGWCIPPPFKARADTHQKPVHSAQVA